MDTDYAIRKYKSPTVNIISTSHDIALYKWWEGSNCLSMMFIKTRISAGIYDLVNQNGKVFNLLKAIDYQFVNSYKATESILIIKFSSTRLTSMREKVLILCIH